MSDFENDILLALEEIVGAEEIETLIRRDESNKDLAVKIIHRPTGIAFECDIYKSQIKNKSVCLIQLLKSLKNNQY